MNMINTIIIEGEVAENFDGNFKLAATRYYKDAEGKNAEEKSVFDVATFGYINEVCKVNATPERGVRVVGRLKQVITEIDGVKASKIVIIAEHVEFKPKVK